MRTYILAEPNKGDKQMRLLILTFCIFAISCSNGDDPTTRTAPIELSTYSVHLLAGEQRIVNILSQLDDFGMGYYGLQSGNPEIATAMWLNESKGIIITGNSIGNTSIYLKDNRNPENSTEIKVTSDYFSGKFKENGDSANIYVQAENLSIQETIKNELKDIAQKRSGILFSFDKSTNIVEIDYSSTAYDNKKTGVYEWEKDLLTLNFNGSVTQHGFAVANDHAVIVVLDFLNKYKSEYPNASVKAASLGCFLSSCK